MTFLKATTNLHSIINYIRFSLLLLLLLSTTTSTTIDPVYLSSIAKLINNDGRNAFYKDIPSTIAVNEANADATKATIASTALKDSISGGNLTGHNGTHAFWGKMHEVEDPCSSSHDQIGDNVIGTLSNTKKGAYRRITTPIKSNGIGHTIATSSSNRFTDLPSPGAIYTFKIFANKTRLTQKPIEVKVQQFASISVRCLCWLALEVVACTLVVICLEITAITLHYLRRFLNSVCSILHLIWQSTRWTDSNSHQPTHQGQQSDSFPYQMQSQIKNNFWFFTLTEIRLLLVYREDVAANTIRCNKSKCIDNNVLTTVLVRIPVQHLVRETRDGAFFLFFTLATAEYYAMLLNRVSLSWAHMSETEYQAERKPRLEPNQLDNSALGWNYKVLQRDNFDVPRFCTNHCGNMFQQQIPKPQVPETSPNPKQEQHGIDTSKCCYSCYCCSHIGCPWSCWCSRSQCTCMCLCCSTWNLTNNYYCCGQCCDANQMPPSACSSTNAACWCSHCCYICSHCCCCCDCIFYCQNCCMPNRNCEICMDEKNVVAAEVASRSSSTTYNLTFNNGSECHQQQREEQENYYYCCGSVFAAVSSKDARKIQERKTSQYIGTKMQFIGKDMYEKFFYSLRGILQATSATRATVSGKAAMVIAAAAAAIRITTTLSNRRFNCNNNQLTSVTNNANDQQLKTKSLSKIFFNNHKRHRRRRRRRRRRHMNVKQEQPLQRQQQQQHHQQPELSVRAKFNSNIISKNTKYNLIRLSAFKTITKTILSATSNTLSSKSYSSNSSLTSSSSSTATTKTTTTTINCSRVASKIGNQGAIANIQTIKTASLILTSLILSTPISTTGSCSQSTSVAPSVTNSGSLLSATCGVQLPQRPYKRRTKTNLVWLLIGLVWFEGPKLAHCNIVNIIAQPLQKEQYRQQDIFLLSNSSSETHNKFTVMASNAINSNSDVNCRSNISPGLPIQPQPDPYLSEVSDRGIRKQRSVSESILNPYETRWHYDPRSFEESSASKNDLMRLESIKRQILSRLGLTHKPNVTHPLPKQFIWDTIYRADGIASKSQSQLTSSNPRQRIRPNHRQRHQYNQYQRNQKGNFFEYNNNNNNYNIKNVHYEHQRDSKANSNVDIISDSNYKKLTYLTNSDSSEESNLNIQPNLGLNDEQIYSYALGSGNGDANRKSLHNLNDNRGLYNEEYYIPQAHSDISASVPMTDHRKDHHPRHFYEQEPEEEDLIGGTQEIITFGERGNLYKHHRLVEFSPQADELTQQRLFIRRAIIHLRVDKISTLYLAPNHKPSKSQSRAAARSKKTSSKQKQTSDNTINGSLKLKIWIFQLMDMNYTHKSFDQVTRFCDSFIVDTKQLGWQKFDITETVRRWFTRSYVYREESGNDNIEDNKLRLLIDCTGCGQKYVLQLFDGPDERNRQGERVTKHSRKRPQKPQKPTFNWQPSQEDQQVQHHMKSKTEGLRQSTGPTRAIGLSPALKNDTVAIWVQNNQNAPPTRPDSVFNEKLPKPYGDRKSKMTNRTDYIEHKDDQPNDCAGGNFCNPNFLMLNAQTSSGYQTNHSIDSQRLNPNRPFLVLHTEMKRLRRVRRRAVDCMGALHGQCCKESFYVSFKALGWDDWIIAPRGYFANYCRGDCTGPFRTPDTFQTFHAHFIEEYRKMGLLNGMQPCCAPVKFSSMSLIYYGDDGIIKRDLPKMVVDECGCP